MNENERCIGNVHYNNDEFLIRKAFINVDTTTHKDDARSRCAYLIVSKKEVLDLCGSLSDDKKVLEDIKTKYVPIVKKAIKSEESIVQKKNTLSSNEIKKDDKLVFLQSIPIYYAKKLESILKTKKFYSECNNLDKESKEKDASKGIAYLDKSKVECDEILLKEAKKYDKELNSNNMKEAYALVLVSYVYNYDKDMQLVLTLEENTESLTLMPKVKVEYGVFFDGTNNNMYNIDFYQDYKKYVKEQSKYIEDNYTLKIDDKEFEYESPIEVITHHPDPEKYPNIINLLRNEIIEKIRYFEPSSNVINNYGKDNASKDSKEVFDFLLEVRNTLKDEDSNFENIIESIKGINGVTGTEEEIAKFIIKNITPSKGNDTSYTNGYTNIKRLYEHYEGNDSVNKNAHKYDLKRLKVYAAGSGTTDPNDRESLDKDSIFGGGLGLGQTGVDAHIIYTCEKIVKKIRKNKITHIDELVFDIFGFSRGAAEARQFVCSIQEEFKLLIKDGYLSYALNTENKNIFSCFYPFRNGLYTKINNKVYFNPLRTDIEKISERVSAGSRSATIYHDNPYYKYKDEEIDIRSISFRHVNIGDTVTHYGFKQSNDSKNLKIHFDKSKVGSVFHLMAADEYRYNFEAHSIFESKYKEIFKKNGNLKEYTIPGAHADVGGGYEKSSSTEIVQIANIHAYDKRKVLDWNKKYKWINCENIDIKDVTSISNLKEKGESGFYNKISNSPNNISSSLYMCRTGISWEYELITLDLMHKEAIDKSKNKKEEDRVPLKSFLDNKYKISEFYKSKKLTSKDYDLLNKVSEKFAEYEKVDEPSHKLLRAKFIHHSSDFDKIYGLVNPPSMEGNANSFDEIYGKRIVYGSKGGVFK